MGEIIFTQQLESDEGKNETLNVGALSTTQVPLFPVIVKPSGAYQGEYGFDWMRLGPDTVDTEDFRSISEDFQLLEDEFETLEVVAGVKYYVPWLCMFPDHKAKIGKDVELLLWTDPIHLPVEYLGDEIIRLIPSNRDIIVTPETVTVNQLITGTGKPVTITCANPLPSDEFIELKLEAARLNVPNGKLVGKINIAKNDHHKKLEIDVVVVENCLIDEPRFDQGKIDAELLKIKKKDDSPVADKCEALKRIEEYLNTQCLNQALIQVKFIYNNRNGIIGAFEWGFRKNTLLRVNEGENPNPPQNTSGVDPEAYNHLLRYKGLFKDITNLRVDARKYRDYINYQFGKGQFAIFARKKCIILYLSGLAIEEITTDGSGNSYITTTHGIASLWPTANKHCLIFNTGINSLPTIGHEIGHVLGLEHTFLPEREDASGNVIKISQLDNIANADSNRLTKVQREETTLTNHFTQYSVYYNTNPSEKQKNERVLNAWKRDEQQIVDDMRNSAALNINHFEKKKTKNIMDYSNNQYYFYSRQWKIMQDEVEKYYGKN